ncbi:hypothetical protein L596_029187 [Steinernema carpocapsae]|uniref:Uncharacterized protein n=1 Tax=Steinernema carpocapsae TaxID=34508 RepID=A0A4U5LTX3_STECR|nr:hypothetical protein L596_029187 [Steinernema carpocapsae]
MTTHGHFYRRYSGVSGSSRSTGTGDSSARSLSASIEPSTCGTSWNSVRWNKPLNLGYAHSSRITSMFNKPSTSTHGTSSYSAPPAQRRPYKPLDSLNMQSSLHSARHSRPAHQEVPYRTRETSREMFSPTKYSSRQVDEAPEKKECSYRSYYWHEPIKPVGIVKLMTIREDSSYLNRMSYSAPREIYSPTKTTQFSSRNSEVPSSVRLTAAATDTARHGRSLSAFAGTTTGTTRLTSPSAKAERPWRQKLAEAARLRNLHGDEVANAIGPKIAACRANRRNSLTRNSESELESSITALKSLVNMDKSSPISKYREKTGNAGLTSFINSTTTPFSLSAPLITRQSRMTGSYNEGAVAAANLAVKNDVNIGPMSQSYTPALADSFVLAENSVIPTEMPPEMNSSVTRRRRSPSARTARRESRQRSLSKSQSRQPSPSSSEDEGQKGHKPREPPRVKRLKKKKLVKGDSQEQLNGPALPPPAAAETQNLDWPSSPPPRQTAHDFMLPLGGVFCSPRNRLSSRGRRDRAHRTPLLFCDLNITQFTPRPLEGNFLCRRSTLVATLVTTTLLSDDSRRYRMQPRRARNKFVVVLRNQTQCKESVVDKSVASNVKDKQTDSSADKPVVAASAAPKPQPVTQPPTSTPQAAPSVTSVATKTPATPKTVQTKAAETVKTASPKSSPILSKKVVKKADEAPKPVEEATKVNGTVEKPKTTVAKVKQAEKPASPKTVKKEPEAAKKPEPVKKEALPAKTTPNTEPAKEPAKFTTKTEAAKEPAKAPLKVEPAKEPAKTPAKAEPKPTTPKAQKKEAVAPKTNGTAVNGVVPKAEPVKKVPQANGVAKVAAKKEAVPKTNGVAKTEPKTTTAKVESKTNGTAKVEPKKTAAKTFKPVTPKTSRKNSASKVEAKPAEAKPQDTEDESKYSAVAHFIPSSLRKNEKKEAVKQPAPVPGTWKDSQQELYISHNKHLKKDGAALKTENTIRARSYMAAKSSKIKVPVPPKKKVLPVVTKTVQKTLTSKKANLTERCTVTIPPLQRTSVTHDFKLKENVAKKELKETARATISPVLNRSLELKVEKTLKLPIKHLEQVSLACDASKIAVTEMSKDFKRKVLNAGAKVTVLASLPLLDINISRLAMKFKVPQLTKKCLTNLIEKQTAIIEDEKKKITAAPKIEKVEDPSSKAQKVLRDMRESFEEENCYASNDHLPSFDYRPGEPIVLPDQSLLEEYVRRKRGKLERLQRGSSVDNIVHSADSSECDTPSVRSTTSELLPACAVRIVEPPQKSVPLITTPSRSRLSSVEKSQITPPPKDANMLELLQYGEQCFNATGSTFRAPLRKPQRSASLTKQIIFDTPLTPFEERMQSQANALRKTNFRPDEDNSVEITMQLPQNKRHSASELTDHKMALCGVAQNFTNAAALSQQPRFERYAAHIPINRSSSSTGQTDPSGRQSTTSMESANSVVLDTASKQLDQMIDQARYRHHQHRTKFKEAIDYLDQIFEDLKKECDHSNEPQGKNSIKNQQQSLQSASNNRDPQQQQRGAPVRRNPQPYQQRYLQEHQPQPVIYNHPIQQAKENGGSGFSAHAEVEVSETIVLPKKLNNEKMDFTRKWLDGDTKMWTGAEPKPDLILGRDDQCESDERSIGSCSAEVAAINASDRRKKQRMRETPDLIQNVTNGGQKRRKQQPQPQPQQQPKPQQAIPAPVRPQPCRPQPTYAMPTTSSLSGSNGQLNITPYSSFSACHPIKRVNSQDQFSHHSEANDAYRTIGSIHSEERYKPDKSNSAFLQYKQQAQNIRGSIQSLPDAGVMKMRKPDLMSIDMLVAELELNTDEAPGSRRSFPIHEEGRVPPAKFSTNIDYEEPKHAKMNRLGQLNGNGAAHNGQVGSMDRGMRRLRQRQQENLDEVTHHMLNNAATDFGATTSGNRTGVYHRGPPAAGAGPTPFETINTERLNPSKVNAIQSMFEPKKSVLLPQTTIFPELFRHPPTTYNLNGAATTFIRTRSRQRRTRRKTILTMRLMNFAPAVTEREV